MRNGFQLFDAHTHIGRARHSGRTYSADDLLAGMDRFGIDRSVVIPFPVVEDYREQHDLIGRAVLSHQDRLKGVACLPPFLPLDVFRGEVARCRNEYGFSALKLQPQYHGLNPIAEKSDFFFEAARDNHMAVICHTGTGLPFAAPSLFILPAIRFPEVQFVIGHSGGGIFVQEAIVAAKVCLNITLELSTLMPHHVNEVLTHISADRMMIGSDLPENVSTEFGKILELSLSDADKQKILSETAARVFA